MTWCEHCRDHFPVRHYDDRGWHRTGREWGPYGELLAAAGDLDRLRPVLDMCRVALAEVHRMFGPVSLVPPAAARALDAIDDLPAGLLGGPVQEQAHHDGERGDQGDERERGGRAGVTPGAEEDSGGALDGGGDG
jgi:hypothetical protein